MDSNLPYKKMMNVHEPKSDFSGNRGLAFGKLNSEQNNTYMGFAHGNRMFKCFENRKPSGSSLGHRELENMH